MAWIFVCDRCLKPSVNERILRRNGEHAGAITIDYRSKTKPNQTDPPDKTTLELCVECWDNLQHWVSGLNLQPPRTSNVPALDSDL